MLCCDVPMDTTNNLRELYVEKHISRYYGELVLKLIIHLYISVNICLVVFDDRL